jgi:5-methylcytosine-specific restriction endonuclease McrA
VLEAQRWCSWCGATENLEVDHIVERRHGGTNGYDNLRVLCRSCHHTRGNRT